MLTNRGRFDERAQMPAEMYAKLSAHGQKIARDILIRTEEEARAAGVHPPLATSSAAGSRSGSDDACKHKL